MHGQELSNSLCAKNHSKLFHLDKFLNTVTEQLRWKNRNFKITSLTI